MGVQGDCTDPSFLRDGDLTKDSSIIKGNIVFPTSIRAALIVLALIGWVTLWTAAAADMCVAGSIINGLGDFGHCGFVLPGEHRMSRHDHKRGLHAELIGLWLLAAAAHG